LRIKTRRSIDGLRFNETIKYILALQLSPSFDDPLVDGVNSRRNNREASVENYMVIISNLVTTFGLN